MSGLKSTTARVQILDKIRVALNKASLPIPFPEVDNWNEQEAFTTADCSIDELFAQNFVALGGKYVYCSNEQEMAEQIQALYQAREWNKLFCADATLQDLFQNKAFDFVLPAENSDESADACITTCEALLARTGSFLISSRQQQGRVSSIFYPVHIVVAYKKDVLPDIAEALHHMQEKYGNEQPSMISIQTGPSRTADIEKTLVTGVHGPKEVFCFFVNA